MVTTTKNMLIRNSRKVATHVTATTSSYYWVPVPRDRTVFAVLAITASSGAVDNGHHFTVSYSSGNHLASVDHVHLGVTSCSSEQFFLGLGPWEGSRYGTIALSTAYGTPIQDNYVTVYLTGSTSSAYVPESTGSFRGTAKLIVFEMPVVSWST